MLKKRVILYPVYTVANPMPFEKALKQSAPEAIDRIIEIHKKDGTVCMLPYCTQPHDTYIVKYKRISILKEVDKK